jgi:hypothetical protein
MHLTAKGSFDATLVPCDLTFAADLPGLGRLSIEKHYYGDLDASSKGEMLSAVAAVKGSGGYVALERVTGTLNGKKGSFVLQHFGTMDRGTPDLTIIVVPDSGTEELAGIEGTMTIEIVEKLHHYKFVFAIPT